MDAESLEKALPYYLDHMSFDVLYLVVLSDTHFAQHDKVVVCSYMQDANTEGIYLFSSLAASELNHTMYVIQFF